MFRKAPIYGLVILFSLAFLYDVMYTSYWITHPWTYSYISYTEEERLNLLPSAELFNPVNWRTENDDTRTNNQTQMKNIWYTDKLVLKYWHLPILLAIYLIYTGWLGAWVQKVGSETFKHGILHSPLSPGWPGASCQACLLHCRSCFSASPVLCQA